MAAIQDKQRNVAKHKAGFVDTHEILDQMVEASMCQICYRLLEKMYTATCGHSYCMNCAAVLLGGNFAAVRQAQISNSTVGYGICPVCRQEIWCAARCSEDGLEREPSLSHSIMIRDNFKALRSWAIWRKGEDDAARAAGKSIGETKCLWRLNGCDTDLDDSSSEFGNASSDTTFTEDAKEDEQYDSDEDGEGSNDEEMSSANDEEPQGTNTAGTSATILLSAQLRAVQRLHRATAQNRLIHRTFFPVTGHILIPFLPQLLPLKSWFKIQNPGPEASSGRLR
ncbi:tripartite motif-containing 31 [Colletotrichum truncatum]|uniref:Tripartite motif-containing 31 n=1 Tax=Colletotrichum truncatum TaxID=5467 RepID=A0ACC3ZG45_COLTU